MYRFVKQETMLKFKGINGLGMALFSTLRVVVQVTMSSPGNQRPTSRTMLNRTVGSTTLSDIWATSCIHQFVMPSMMYVIRPRTSADRYWRDKLTMGRGISPVSFTHEFIMSFIHNDIFPVSLSYRSSAVSARNDLTFHTRDNSRTSKRHCSNNIEHEDAKHCSDVLILRVLLTCTAHTLRCASEIVSTRQ